MKWEKDTPKWKHCSLQILPCFCIRIPPAGDCTRFFSLSFKTTDSCLCLCNTSGFCVSSVFACDFHWQEVPPYLEVLWFHQTSERQCQQTWELKCQPAYQFTASVWVARTQFLECCQLVCEPLLICDVSKLQAKVAQTRERLQTHLQGLRQRPHSLDSFSTKRNLQRKLKPNVT